MVALTPEETAALADLGAYNSGAYHVTLNPKGMGGRGYKVNLTDGMNQVALLFNTFAEIADGVDQAADDIASATVGAPLTTSATSLAIGTGAKVFAVTNTTNFDRVKWAVAESQADPSKWMHGTVEVTDTNELTLTVGLTNGSGTAGDWKIKASGPQGVATGLANIVEDTTPQLGGTLDAQGNQIINADLSPSRDEITLFNAAYLMAGLL